MQTSTRKACCCWGWVRIDVPRKCLEIARPTRSGRQWLWLALRLGLWVGFSLGGVLLWIIAADFLFRH